MVKVSGLQQLGEAMRGLSADMNNRIARAATGAGAQVIKKNWRERVPVAAEAHTEYGVTVAPGTYRDNIISKHVAASQTRFTSEHWVLVQGGRRHSFASHIASLLEFGTVHISPRAYARQTYEIEKGAAVEALKEKIAAGIAKAGK